MLRSELRAGLRGDGAAAWASAALIASVLALLVARRTSQGAVAPSAAIGDITTVLAQVLPLLVLIGAGTRAVQRRERGLDIDQHLAGIALGHRLLVVVADALLLLLALQATLLVWMVGATGDLSCLIDRATTSAAGGLMLAALLLTLLAAALGRLVSGTAPFVLASVLMTVVGSALYWAGPTNPAFDDLARLWPTQASTTFFTASSSRGWALGMVAAAFTAIAAGAVLLRTADLTRPELRRRSDTMPRPGRPPRSAPQQIRRLVALGAAVVCWGVIVPQTLAAQVPWYLRPAWLQQESEHRSSADVARTWLSAVQSGDTAVAARWASASMSDIMGPLSPYVESLDPSTAHVEKASEAHPGQVVLERSGQDQSLGTVRIYVCLRPRGNTWEVTGMRSAGDCPAPPGVRP